MTNRRVLTFLTAILLAGSLPALFVGSQASPAARSLDLNALAGMIEREEDHLTPREVDSLLASGIPLTIFDLRDSAAYAGGHLPGARRSSLSELTSLPPDPASRIVLYSEGGVHAGQAWVLLKAAGHSQVHTLFGSWRGWNSLQSTASPQATQPAAKKPNESRERERLNGEC